MSDDYWTAEPIEAWKVVLHSMDEGIRHGWPEYFTPGLATPVYPAKNLRDAATCYVGGWVPVTGGTGWEYQLKHEGPAPSFDCVCGWYSWKTVSQALTYAVRVGSIGGVVRDWTMVETWKVFLTGTVIEHELGYRSEYVTWVDKWSNLREHK